MNEVKRKIPTFLHDNDGNLYQMIVEHHRDGFNLVTFRLDWKDYEEE